MRYKKTIVILVICIVVLSLAASAYGVFSSHGGGNYEFKSMHGETVQVYGKGLYKNDSVSIASQGIAQDIVTLFLCIPLLIVSTLLAVKGLLRGKLLLAGTLGYFLYTYTSYSFLWMYNPLFLVYVALMSLSLFAFILTMMSFDLESFVSHFNNKMPVKFLGSFLIFFAIMIGLMWLGRIVPPLLNGIPPVGLEHYTTLVIQAMDLGLVVPASITAGLLLIKKKPFGYLLASIMIVKFLSMGAAVTAMVISQVLAGVTVSILEIVLFPFISLLIILCLFIVIKNIKEPGYSIKKSL